MISQWEIIYEYCNDPSCGPKGGSSAGRHPSCNHEQTVLIQPIASKRTLTFRMPIALSQFLGIALLAIGIGGILGPMTQNIRLEAAFLTKQAQLAWNHVTTRSAPQLPTSAPVVFEPLKTPDGSSIEPVNENFSLIVPKVGINAAVIPGVNPMKPNDYIEALKKGVAHASTSFFPDQDGTVYLFSHSTNYDWFVSDLNAVFYLLKNLEKDDVVVLIYKGKRYTYKITDKKVVSPNATAYLAPVIGKRNLILQTCWPPGSVAERLLIFADLIEDNGKQI